MEPADKIAATLDYASMLRKEGDAADVTKAVQLYQTAADQGSVEASLVLARMLPEGREVQRDPTAASSLMRRAVGRGSTEAMVALGDHLAAAKGEAGIGGSREAVRCCMGKATRFQRLKSLVNLK